MKLISFIVGFLVSVGAAWADSIPVKYQQQEASFSFFSRYTYYNCDYVEDRVEDILQSVGARNINVRCFGGLPDFTANNVRVTFESLVEATAADASGEGSRSVVELRFVDSCDLHETIMDRLIDETITIYAIEKVGRCEDSRGRLTYTLEVLK